VANSFPIAVTQHVPIVQSPGFNTYQKHSHLKLKRMSDMSDSTMGHGLNKESVKMFLFTLLTE